MNIVSYEPWNLFQRFHHEINRVYDNSVIRRQPSEPHWAPAVDVREEAGSYLIEVDVPGVDPKDIEITTEEGALVIKGRANTSPVNQPKGSSVSSEQEVPFTGVSVSPRMWMNRRSRQNRSMACCG